MLEGLKTFINTKRDELFFEVIDKLEKVDSDADDSSYKKYFDLLSDVLCNKLKNTKYGIVKTNISTFVYNTNTQKICFLLYVQKHQIEDDITISTYKESQNLSIYKSDDSLKIAQKTEHSINFDSSEEEVFEFLVTTLALLSDKH